MICLPSAHVPKSCTANCALRLRAKRTSVSPHGSDCGVMSEGHCAGEEEDEAEAEVGAGSRSEGIGGGLSAGQCVNEDEDDDDDDTDADTDDWASVERGRFPARGESMAIVSSSSPEYEHSDDTRRSSCVCMQDPCWEPI